MNTLMIYPEIPDTFWSFKHAVKFVNKKATNPPLGLLTIASMLPQEWVIRLVDQNVTLLTDEDIRWADLIMISAMEVQQESTHTVISQIRRNGKKLIVAGGPLFLYEHQNYPEVDCFVLNEAEITLPQFLSDMASGNLKPIYTSEEFPDIRTSPIPKWSLLELNKYDSMAVQFSRGCPFQCDFCNVTAMLGHKPRVKSTKQLIQEIDQLYQMGWRRNIFIVDDNFIGNKAILKDELLPALIEWRKGKTGCLLLTEASINLADDPILIDLMVRAGFSSVFIGIETPDETGLEECNKKQNKNRDMINSVKLLQRKGLQVMAGFILGFDSDQPSIFQRQIDFIQESGIVTAMVGLLQAPYGTPLYKRMKNERRLLPRTSGDNMDGRSNILPKMEADVLHAGYRQILSTIYAPVFLYQRIKTCLLEFQPGPNKYTMSGVEVIAFLISILIIGIKEKERLDYWRLFFWVLFKFPSKLPLAITLAIYGYHFRKVCELHVLPYVHDISQRPAPLPATMLAEREQHPIYLMK